MWDERMTRRALALVVEAGDPRIGELVGRYGVEGAWRLIQGAGSEAAWSRRALSVDVDAAVRAEERCGARFVIPGDDEWPPGLDDLAACGAVQDRGGVPLGLWVCGRVPFVQATAGAVAIVGSRACSPYGERVASGLAAELAEARHPVVSGGAYGIDAAAHRGALAGDGVTVAFLASGVDEPYPRQNASLLDQVAATGVVVSEYPPGEHPTRPRFLARNRLIAAASAGTVIVEAAHRSGARNTVSWATALGRPVMAVPGPVTNVTSATPHRLIREGEAVLVTSAAEIRELVSPLGAVALERPRRAQLLDALPAPQRAVYEALPTRGGRDAEDLALRAELGYAETLSALSELECAGLAMRRPDGGWRLGEVTNRPLLPLDPGRAP